MIDPEWLAFPKEYEKHGTTQFLLELAPDAPKSKIQDNLRAFDPTQLLFLRRLKKAEVWVEDERMSVKREDFPDSNAYNGEIRRLTVSKHKTQTETITDYVIVKHTIQVTHESSKRAGVQKTDVVLAFPVSSSSPIIQPQNAYNFLPIRKTSFSVSGPLAKP
jgi:hypothetical protein